LPQIAWEWNQRGGWEAWHAPAGVDSPRRAKTYLGYFGKRELARWGKKPGQERLQMVLDWIAEKRKAKGL
jgi:hypothetical protein